MGLQCFAIVALAVCTISSVCARSLKDSAVAPEITLKFWNNSEHVYVENQPKLQPARMLEVCHTGVWILYNGENYTYTDDPYEWGTIEIFPELGPDCHIPFNDLIRSVRFPGSRPDNSVPSVTFYQNISMQYESISVEEGVNSLPWGVMSMVMINTNVEFFKEENYRGESYCFAGKPDNCNGSICWLWWWNEEDELPWNFVQAKSARAGCTSGVPVIYAKSIGNQEKPSVSRKSPKQF